MSRGSSRGSALPLKRPRAVSSLTEAEPRVHSRPRARTLAPSNTPPDPDLASLARAFVPPLRIAERGTGGEDIAERGTGGPSEQRSLD